MGTVLFVFLVYLAGMILVGIVTARLASRSLDDFILGGKRMWTPVIAVSEKGTDMSAWLLIGLPGQAFKIGMGAIWAGIGVWLGSLFNWLVIATPLRKLTGRFNALTLPDYFESRFQDTSHLLRILENHCIYSYRIFLHTVCFCTGSRCRKDSGVNLQHPPDRGHGNWFEHHSILHHDGWIHCRIMDRFFSRLDYGRRPRSDVHCGSPLFRWPEQCSLENRLH